MQAEFGIYRELQNKLYFSQYKNPSRWFHFHSQLELHFVDEGEIEVWINDKRKVLQAGEASVALSYDAHCYQTIGESRASLVVIPTDLCEEFLYEVKNKRTTTPFIQNKEALEKLRTCYREMQAAENNRIKQLGYIYVLLGILMEEMQFEPLSSPIDTTLSSGILFYINEHYKENITLQSVAATLGYNPGYLSRYFKSCFQIGITQYITVIRLRAAVTLLHEGKHNVTYCALESGFNSVRSFYRAFAREFDCSPKEYLAGIRAPH